MDLNLRAAILENISSNDQSQLEATIVDAIQSGEEKMLPGLGVLFELIWNEADGQHQQQMVETLEKGIQHATNQ
ncbi:MAG TPA: small acid-soluble spore protein SspI [Bacillota bacterium]|nr:small acid-soluble spore protein SspI [Bacillota bacterium]